MRGCLSLLIDASPQKLPGAKGRGSPRPQVHGAFLQHSLASRSGPVGTDASCRSSKRRSPRRFQLPRFSHRRTARGIPRDIYARWPFERRSMPPELFRAGDIAAAIIRSPELILADEPTTALDATIQDQILALLRQLCRDLGMSVVLVTHDIGIVAETCERVGVMYAGRLVETGSVADVLGAASHPLYGRAPRLDPADRRAEDAAPVDFRPAARPDQADRRLPVRAALHLCARRLPGVEAAPRAARVRPALRLPRHAELFGASLRSGS
jgi:hypothetical protein